MYENQSKKGRVLWSVLASIVLLATVCAFGTVDGGSMDLRVTATGSASIEPSPTPFPTPPPFVSCWIYGPALLVPCDPLPPRPGEGTGSLPLLRGEHMIFFPAVEIPCRELALAIDEGRVVVVNDSCETISFRAYRLRSVRTGARVWLSGMIEPGRQARAVFLDDRWQRPFTLSTYEGEIVASVE